MNEQQKVIDDLLKSYNREVINYPYLRTDSDKEKSKEKLNDTHEMIIKLSDEIKV